jgi:hypothetical protein
MSMTAAQPVSQPLYAPCAKSGDIDGKGTAELFSPEGWIFESHEFKSQEVLTSKTLAALTLLAEAFEARGAKLILVPVPTRAIRAAETVDLTRYPQVRFSAQAYTASWNSMVAQARATGITVVDLLPTIVSFKTNTRGEGFFYPRDHHWTMSGMEVAAEQIAAEIDRLAKAQNLSLERQEGSLKVSRSGEFVGSIGEHYAKACGTEVKSMPLYDATYTVESISLLDDVEPLIGIFGDSFGLSFPYNTYNRPDKNFSVMLEAKTGLPTINNSVSGNGKTATLAGYLADPKLVAKLPPYVVVPFMGGLSNNVFDYGQMRAALLGCSDATRLIKTEFAAPSPKMTFTPKLAAPSTGKSLIHIHTDVPANYLEVRQGTYTDASPLSFEIYRTSAPYYTGSRTDFYSMLADDKTVRSLTVQLDKLAPVSGYIEICQAPDVLH